MKTESNSLTAQLPVWDEVNIGVIGLGYVGLPLALALSQHGPVVGFDIDQIRVSAILQHVDVTGEISKEEFVEAGEIIFSSEVASLTACNVFIITVPTPVNQHNYPDLDPLRKASATVGALLHRGNVVIYESTVYPGATEEVCVPVLEAHSQLCYNEDFYCGYSPERINPGDRARRLADILKITAGSTPAVAKFVDNIYRRIIVAGTHQAPSIRVAEAAKAIENTQRDVNIALVNELAMMFHRMGLDTEAVLAAAGTKWNFLNFKPGLVGGHCIGVDPYYLIHKAQECGYHPELILASRRINSGMACYITDHILRLMALKQINVVGSRILMLGIAFKENCPDLRNTQAANIVHELQRFHAQVDVYDPWVDPIHCAKELDINVVDAPSATLYDAVIIAVAHNQFKALGAEGIRAKVREGGVIYDVKHLLPQHQTDGRL